MGSAIKGKFGMEAAAGGTPSDVKFNIALGPEKDMTTVSTTAGVMKATGRNSKAMLHDAKATHGENIPNSQKLAAAQSQKLGTSQTQTFSSRTMGHTVGQPSGMNG